MNPTPIVVTTMDYADYAPHPYVLCVIGPDRLCEMCGIHEENCRICGINRSICLDLPCPGDIPHAWALLVAAHKERLEAGKA